MKLICKKMESKKSGKIFWVIGLDIGYAFKHLSYDKLLVSELTNVSVRELNNAPVGQDFEIKLEN